MITTIQLNEQVKNSLDKMKESRRETYEEVIVKIMKIVEEQKRTQRELLIEGCKEMAEDSIKITKDFESVDSEIDLEWNEN